jgi:hypothetical protein
MKKLLRFYAYLRFDLYGPLERSIRLNRGMICNLSDSYCKQFFRFSQQHLQLLFTALSFPISVTLNNRSVFTGEELFLRGLYELSTGETQNSIAEHVFGRHASDQSRAFIWFCQFMYETYSHLLFDNLLWWKQFMSYSYNKIQSKIGIDCPYKVALFIDCNCSAICAPGSGPRTDGSRWDKDIQRSLYNAWKSFHGIKYQTVDNAFGMTVDLTGPYSHRRHDLALCRISDINNRLRDLFDGEGDDNQYIVFGDSAYREGSHIKSYNNEGFIGWNAAM